MIKKKHVNAFVIATTLVVPFSGIMAQSRKLKQLVEMKANSRLTDGTYDVVFKSI